MLDVFKNTLSLPFNICYAKYKHPQMFIMGKVKITHDVHDFKVKGRLNFLLKRQISIAALLTAE